MESPFTNSRNALILAGVILTAALIISVIASSFAPASIEPDLAASEQAEEPVQSTQVASAPEPAAGWADDGGFSDDWGAAATSPVGGSSSNRPSELGDFDNQPEFGEYGEGSSPSQSFARGEDEGPTYKAPSAVGNRQVQPGTGF